MAGIRNKIDLRNNYVPTDAMEACQGERRAGAEIEPHTESLQSTKATTVTSSRFSSIQIEFDTFDRETPEDDKPPGQNGTIVQKVRMLKTIPCTHSTASNTILEQWISN